MAGRKEKVLEALKEAYSTGQIQYGPPNGMAVHRTLCRDGWVDGPVLASGAIGGSEGLRRLRELRAAGWPIEDRKHPQHGRAVRQYRLTSLVGPE